MNENRRQILEMLAAGKINAEEAERLISALEGPPATKRNPRRRHAQAQDQGQVPARACRNGGQERAHHRQRPRAHAASLRRRPSRQPYSLTGPRAARRGSHKHGVPLTLSQIKPENLTELIDHLEELTVDVDAKQDNTKVRVFCE